MRLYVVNVGVNAADAARGGARSPIFPDGTFEFVPIKEAYEFASCAEIPRYCDLPTLTRRAQSLATYVPAKMSSYRVHDDPEFETYTYGDVRSSRASNLKYVELGDQLWFLARLWNHDGSRWTRGSDFYFVGRFEVEQNILVPAKSERGHFSCDSLRRIERNAHYRRWVHANGQEEFRIIAGSHTSQRFRRALRVTPDIAGLLFRGQYDPKSGMFHSGGEVLKNRNGAPRRVELFGSVTRTVQAFLDTGIAGDTQRVAELTRLAVDHAS
jgi:hypothetical protein